MLEFIKDTHTYVLNGAAILPSVTQVLAGAGLIREFDGSETTGNAARFGTAVHRAVELDLRGDLDESSLDPALVPSLEGWRRFRSDFPKWEPTLELVEKPMYHPQLYYAGTPDVPMSLAGKKLILVDIKTGAEKVPYYPLQQAAYERLLNSHLGLPETRKWDKYVLWLDFTAPLYRLNKVDHPLAWPTFIGAMNVYRWRKEHGPTL